MRARSLSSYLVLLLLGASCASSSQSDSSERLVSEQEIFQAGQEAIRDCMALEGFEYTPRVHIDGGKIGISRTIDLSVAGTIGYGGVFASISSATNPSGSPVVEMTKSESEAYTKALFGREDSEIEDPNSDQGSSETFRPGGCFAVGQTVTHELETEVGRLDWRDPDVSDRSQELIQRLASTSDYSLFEGEWSVCMADDGYVVSDALRHPRSTSFDFLIRADEFLEGRSRAEFGDYEQLVADLGIEPVRDLETFEAALEQLPGLREIFDEEKAMAEHDKACRDVSFPLIKDVLDELSEEYFGVPYDNL